MRPRNHTLSRLALASVAVTATVAGVLTAIPADATVNPRPLASSQAAEKALARVQALRAPAPLGQARARTATPTAQGDLTMAMRDLRRLRGELSTGDQKTATTLLARPSTTTYRDFGDVRVHYSTSGSDKSTSAYVNEVGDVVTHVLETYVDAGYRSPRSDGTRGGGSGLLDIYLQNLGPQTYGYCDSDTAPPSNGPYDTWAYCAFDNNYAEFPAHTPLENLEVTAAHELFHAVQFAYDYDEDAWFMEATATWAEDEVYTDVNDNLQYLAQSPLSQPRKSMDHFSGVRQYGDWIFFRYLSEKFPKKVGQLPVLMRDLWERVDGAAGGQDEYSMQAVDRELKARGTKLRKVFAEFADANRHPGSSYSEGADNSYPAAPLIGTWNFSPRKRDSDWRRGTLDHLTSSTVKMVPSSAMRSGWRLKVALDLPKRSHGSGAVVSVYGASGGVTSHYVALDRKGDARTSVPFGTRSVSRVEVTMANAGIDYKCWQGTNFSCQGRSRDNDRTIKIRAQAVRTSSAS
ncbi:MXAN_6640 family putative metalloprotease [Nocardioides sp. CN2-186]|uniref:MXAN_6640 family putative metalloprotease n=1 Tax=Nocardioides tweenelious TaxID=3156607 RepID=UPI0032B521C1